MDFDDIADALLSPEKPVKKEKTKKEEKVEEEKKEEKKEVSEDPFSVLLSDTKKEEKNEVKKEEPKPPVRVEQKPKKVTKKELKKEIQKTEETKTEKTNNVVKIEGLPIEEESAEFPKHVWIIYGRKGVGKTTAALSFPGTIMVLSFDRKSAIIKNRIYKGDPRIHVFDVVKIMNYKDQTTITESAAKVYDLIIKLLEAAEDTIKPDWIVFDAAEVMQQICEWTMRYNNELPAFAGISNLNLWKERRMLIRLLHNRALNAANKGIIYTTFTTVDELIINGEVITRKEVPKWIDVLVYETDFVVKIERDAATKSVYAVIDSSKDDSIIKTGEKYDITNKKFYEVIQ